MKGLAPVRRRSPFHFSWSIDFTRRPPAMADRIHKVPENVPGRFYVDVTCIDCDLCRETAPLNFRRDDAGRHSYVYRQPGDAAQEAACAAALEECPVEAIGRDG